MERDHSGQSLQQDPAPVRRGSALRMSDLAHWLVAGGQQGSLIGLEVEYGLVDRKTARAVGYGGKAGSRELILRLADRLGGGLTYDGNLVTGTELSSGARFSLEAAGTIEYASHPRVSLVDAVRDAQRHLTRAAAIAEELDIYILTGGLLPFDSPASMDWLRKPRVELLREHFRHLGKAGRYADHVIATTLSTQVSFDAATPGEYMEKLKALLGASPYLAALLAASPALQRQTSGPASMRLQYWRAVDPHRCQQLTGRLWQARDTLELAGLLASMPMIYRRSGGDYVHAPRLPFARLLDGGFVDGRLTVADWAEHLNQLWPAVRPRRTLETRLPDGQQWRYFAVVPALFAGLVEQPTIRRDVAAVTAGVTASELDATLVTGAQRGWAGLPPRAKETTRELLRLARRGLEMLASERAEASSLASELDVLDEIVETDRSISEDLLVSWQHRFGQDPAVYAEVLRVPPG